MKLAITIPELPPGWVFDGLWDDNYEKDITQRWSVTVAYRQDKKTVFSIETHGETPQEAADKVSATIAETIAFITATKDWLAGVGFNPEVPERMPEGTHTH